MVRRRSATRRTVARGRLIRSMHHGDEFRSTTDPAPAPAGAPGLHPASRNLHDRGECPVRAALEDLERLPPTAVRVRDPRAIRPSRYPPENNHSWFDVVRTSRAISTTRARPDSSSSSFAAKRARASRRLKPMKNRRSGLVGIPSQAVRIGSSACSPNAVTACCAISPVSRAPTSAGIARTSSN